MDAKERNSILLLLSVLSVLSVVTSTFLTSPVALHIAPFAADVKVSGTCNSDRDRIKCNTACPSRTDFPPISNTPLASKESHCKDASSGLPHFVNASHGTIDFTSGDNCTSVNTTVGVGTSNRLTLSVWFQISSSFTGYVTFSMK